MGGHYFPRSLPAHFHMVKKDCEYPEQGYLKVQTLPKLVFMRVNAITLFLVYAEITPHIVTSLDVDFMR